LQQLRDQLERTYPDLRVTIQGDLVWLEGSFPVVHDGVELDRFQTKVGIPEEFPEKIPVAWETNGRVPISADWHTYDKGALCVIVPEEWLVREESCSILAFLDGPLRNYFLGHLLAESGQQRTMGERSHGLPGLYEAYGEMVGSTEPATTRKFLECLSKDRIKGHWDCPCGSGKRLRKCHMVHLLALRSKICPRIAKMALKRLSDQSATRVDEKPGPSHPPLHR
jgi:hypothetical protein